MKGGVVVGSSRLAGLLAIVLATVPVVCLSGQSIDITTGSGALYLRAPGFGFIEGLVLQRLREGRSVRVDFDLAVLERPEGPTVRQTQQSFTLSFDLWEERFAVTRISTPPRSVSHLRAKSAEAWCLENVTIPTAALGRLGRDAPFWIRLAYRVQDVVNPAGSGEGFTLRTLIDRLSRRQGESELGRRVEAGPFRLPN